MSVDFPAFGNPIRPTSAEQTQLQREPPLLPGFALVGKGGDRRVAVAERPVTQAPLPPRAATNSSPAAARSAINTPLSSCTTVPGGNQDEPNLTPAGAVALAAFAVAPPLGFHMGVSTHFEERSDGAIGAGSHTAAVATVTAVGSALGLVRLVMPADDTISAGSSYRLDASFVDERHLVCCG